MAIVRQLCYALTELPTAFDVTSIDRERPIAIFLDIVLCFLFRNRVYVCTYLFAMIYQISISMSQILSAFQ